MREKPKRTKAEQMIRFALRLCRRRRLEGNPLDAGYSFRAPPSLSYCPLGDGGNPAFALRGDMCEMCDTAGRLPSNYFRQYELSCTDLGSAKAETSGVVAILYEPSFYIAVLFTPLALLILYRFASSTWRPSNRGGVECVVSSGALLGGKGAEEASKLWALRLAAHLDVSEAEIRVDHV